MINDSDESSINDYNDEMHIDPEYDMDRDRELADKYYQSLVIEIPDYNEEINRLISDSLYGNRELIDALVNYANETLDSNGKPLFETKRDTIVNGDTGSTHQILSFLIPSYVVNIGV